MTHQDSLGHENWSYFPSCVISFQVSSTCKTSAHVGSVNRSMLCSSRAEAAGPAAPGWQEHDGAVLPLHAVLGYTQPPHKLILNHLPPLLSHELHVPDLPLPCPCPSKGRNSAALPFVAFSSFDGEQKIYWLFWVANIKFLKELHILFEEQEQNASYQCLQIEWFVRFWSVA